MTETDTQSDKIYNHLQSGASTTCRCWLIERKDGWSRGFTDHDCDLIIDGVCYAASTGFSAGALEMTTGLALNNTEAIGAISDVGISEVDIEAGRFDGSTITCWLVNWNNPEQRAIRFKGSIGEVERRDDAFSAELVGLTEKLNLPQGRVYQRECSALLGDDKCMCNLNVPEYFAELPVVSVVDSKVFRFDCPEEYTDGWFERGKLEIRSGAAQNLWGWIKNDLIANGLREITLWQGLRADIQVGDIIRLEAGCDKTAATCSAKFGNFLNFRGCPHIPGEDWLTSYPRSGTSHNGGSMNTPIVS